MVAYFITRFPSKNFISGGAEYVAYHLAKEIAKRYQKVLIFCFSENNKDISEMTEGLEIHKYAPKIRFGKGAFSIRIFSIPANYDFDLVHSHFSVPFAEFAGMKVSQKKKVPFLITYHGDWDERYGSYLRRGLLWFLNRFFVKKLLESAKFIIVPSEDYIEVSKFLPYYREKIKVIPNGIDLKPFEISKSKEECREILGLPKDKQIILYLGSLINYKSPDVLLKAIPLVCQRNKEVLFVFVGSGPMYNELKKTAVKLGIENFVRFEGFVEEGLKPLYYKSAEIFVLPSTMRTEVFPVVLLEASASGLPMVTSDLETFKCIINDGYNGLFTKRGDPKSLADAISYLLENEDLRKRMGKNAKERVREYTWEKIAEKYERVYEEVLR